MRQTYGRGRMLLGTASRLPNRECQRTTWTERDEHTIFRCSPKADSVFAGTRYMSVVRIDGDTFDRSRMCCRNRCENEHSLENKLCSQRNTNDSRIRTGDAVWRYTCKVPSAQPKIKLCIFDGRSDIHLIAATGP